MYLLLEKRCHAGFDLVERDTRARQRLQWEYDTDQGDIQEKNPRIVLMGLINCGVFLLCLQCLQSTKLPKTSQKYRFRRQWALRTLRKEQTHVLAFRRRKVESSIIIRHRLPGRLWFW